MKELNNKTIKEIKKLLESNKENFSKAKEIEQSFTNVLEELKNNLKSAMGEIAARLISIEINNLKVYNLINEDLGKDVSKEKVEKIINDLINKYIGKLTW